jgi:molybdopterin-guanine dinucleotide biosynthesis protein A
VTVEPARLGGILLTGGASTRLGFDKALLKVDGVPNAVRLGTVLSHVADLAVEVGPGRSGLPAVLEEPPGSGPLAAVCAGVRALAARGHSGPALVLACDMPFMDATILKVIASRAGDASIVPLVGGKPQPLCARWSAPDLALACRLAQAGERSMKALLAKAIFATFGPGDWPVWIGDEAFADVDTRADLEGLGLSAEVVQP